MKIKTLLSVSVFVLVQLIFGKILAQSEINKCKIYFLGTIHSNHLISDLGYTLTDLTKTIEIINPDLICIEMTEGALGKDLEGYFPPENAVILEYAKENGIDIQPIDWRYDLNKEAKKYTLTSEQRNKIKETQKKVDQIVFSYLSENDWRGYFSFIQNDKNFHSAIKNQHNVKIKLLGEESDGYWLTRNEKIVERLNEKIKESKPKVVLVTFGLHHKYIIEDLLMNKFKVKTEEVPRLINSENSAKGNSVIGRWTKNKEKLEKILKNDEISNELKNKIIQSGRVKKLEGFINSKGMANKKIRHLFEK
ncbi:MAG: hypothetical protein ACEPOW_14325 [Bacteroidales bacterium]